MTNIFDDDIPKQENHKVDVFNIPVHDKEIDLENMSNHTSNNINNNHGYISENISHQSHVNIT